MFFFLNIINKLNLYEKFCIYNIDYYKNFVNNDFGVNNYYIDVLLSNVYTIVNQI